MRAQHWGRIVQAALISGLLLVSSGTFGEQALATTARTAVLADTKRAHANERFQPDTASIADTDASMQKHPKLDGTLALLSRAAQIGGVNDAIATARSRDIRTNVDRVQVVVESTDGNRAGPRAAIRAVGGTIEAEYQDAVQASVPIAGLEQLASNPSVRYVERPTHGVPDAVAGEEVGASGAAVWQAAGRAGSGVKVAVIDFGFTGYQTRQAAGDLPNNLVPVDMCGGLLNAPGGEHGTAVAEIVYEMAPGVQLYLICVDTSIQLGQAKDYAKANGIQVIAHSASWFNTSRGDGTGSSASSPSTTVADARNSGILWVNSAGNRAQQHWSGVFSDTDGNGLHNFAANDNGNTFRLSVGQQICAYLRWDSWPTTSIDYDLRITTSNTGQLVAQSATLQNGSQPPLEDVCYTNNTGTIQNFAISILKKSGSGSPLMELFVIPGPDLEWQVAAGSITDPGSSPNAFAVAAVCWQNNRLEDYSSRGPTIDGRVKPDIAGQSVVSSGAFGPWTACPANGNGTGNTAFNGTSAAAPTVAGAAALVKGAFPAFSATDIQTFLEQRAQDVGTPGKDTDFGFGILTLSSPNPIDCSTRPSVNVQSTVVAGRLSVTVTAAAGNTINSISFGNPTRSPVNALLDLPDGRTGVTGSPTLNLPAHPTSTTFFVRRQTAGQDVFVPLTVNDSFAANCGSWQTFVGGGSAAGF